MLPVQNQTSEVFFIDLFTTRSSHFIVSLPLFQSEQYMVEEKTDLLCSFLTCVEVFYMNIQEYLKAGIEIVKAPTTQENQAVQIEHILIFKSKFTPNQDSNGGNGIKGNSSSEKLLAIFTRNPAAFPNIAKTRT